MRKLAIPLLVGLCVGLTPGVAMATWDARGTGTASARAEVMPLAGAPTASASGRDVTLSWPPSSFGSGAHVAGYVVRRYDAVSGVPQAVGPGCDGVVGDTGCLEVGVDPGQWVYSLTPVHDAWTGIESAPTAAVSIASPNLTVTPTTIATLPATLTGSLAGFLTGESVTFRLDDPGTGTVLDGTIAPDPVPGDGAAAISVAVPGGVSVGAHTVYAVGSTGTLAGAPIAVIDGMAPSVGAGAVGKTQGGVPGYIRQAGTYYVFASVTDPGDPATGIASVTADASALTPGQTTIPLVGGSWTVGGVAYNYRSASMTATTPLAEGPRAFSITAQDAAGNVVSRTGFTVVVDNTRPSATDIQTANTSGGTVGRPETGDTMTLTLSEPVEPASILAAWNGTSTIVTVRLVQNASGDRLQVWDAANATQLPFGTMSLGRTDYVTASRNVPGSTMLLAGSAIVITLGTPSGAVGTAAGSGTVRWTPVTTPYDRAANACLTTARNESGAADPEF